MGNLGRLVRHVKTFGPVVVSTVTVLLQTVMFTKLLCRFDRIIWKNVKNWPLKQDFFLFLALLSKTICSRTFQGQK
jgi:hypothetical protein